VNIVTKTSAVSSDVSLLRKVWVLLLYDVIVIGGGPSGLMAAISAAEHGAKTLLVEKGKKLGNKLAISGGGRCNVTNRLPEDEIIKHIPGNGKFLYSAFSVFNNEDIIDFFEGLGVALKEEDHGRMFPVSDSAQSVVQTLIKQLDKLKVTIKINSPVETVLYGDKHIVYLENGEKIATKAVVIAVGGKSVPHTGSTGDGYAWAKIAGHRITDLYPTEVPLTSAEGFIKDRTLQGLSLRDVALSVLDKKNKAVVTHKMDMIFTHFGISGPAVLRCSQFVVKEIMAGRKRVKMLLDLYPELNEEQVRTKITAMLEGNSRKAIKNALKDLAPERFLLFILEKNKISPDLQVANMSNQMMRQIIGDLKSFQFYVNGSLSIEKAFVTGGGVHLPEIVPSTMGSKLMERLYFSGEILDIHGYTGGYNITTALVTGRIAGMYAAFDRYE